MFVSGLLIASLLTSLGNGNTDYKFKCKPKAGCDLSKCDPIPESLLQIEGFDPEEYRRRNAYHITCQTEFNMAQLMTSEDAKKSSGQGASTYVSEIEVKNMLADLKKEFEKSREADKKTIASQTKEVKQLSDKVTKLTSKLSQYQINLSKIEKTCCAMEATKEVKATKETTVVPVDCASKGGFTHENKCYWFTWGQMNFDQAQKACSTGGGKPGDVLGQSHYQRIELLARKKMTLNYINFWTGMKINPQTQAVTLSDNSTAKFTKWISSAWIKSDTDHTHIKIELYENLAWAQGMFNHPPGITALGVLCQA